jgi:hypothetical protein
LFLAGERFMQQNNQPTFFSPYPGVTEVVINQSVDRVKVGKVVQMFIWLLNIFGLLLFLRKSTVR